jgi:hypothetical protein
VEFLGLKISMIATSLGHFPGYREGESCLASSSWDSEMTPGDHKS